MYLTQDEAADILCQETFGEQEARFDKCVGTECMGWRWSEKMSKPRIIDCEDKTALVAEDGAAVEFVPDGYKFVPAKLADIVNTDGSPLVDKAARWVEPEDQAKARRRGYCGKAGIPSYE